ncbi:common plant regulatory factor 1-like isoform X3 [Phalaenopsis equestris]|uniref:common plant regulatory factor 1-like isoform X2 n=1 Tax=Phalaenopsis equestris TaxID=78828 RepID=UPI0009E2ED3B|nr:common plant regulatory factor 1-like isoform X2 [Phalaenopsis equestris]XP_020599844.1 common plant regulatory factor 1-like isoform X3 [Phalaenopsis equestris]
MGANETIAPSKTEKSSSVMPEQPSVRSFPDWGSMQAYYGPGIPIPAPFFGSPVAPGHAPYPYMWSPQPMLTPFGGPYTAIFPHGGVYPHPSATHIPSPVNQEVSVNPSTNKEKGATKKIKGIDVLIASSGNQEASAGCNGNRSESDENEAEGSSGGSNGNSESGGSEKQRNISSEDLPNSDVLPTISLGMTATPGAAAPMPMANLTPGMDPRSSSASKQKPGSELILSSTAIDERTLKREKRKQSNRESARRSRLRKQAETEELAMKVGSLNAENATLRSEISRLNESSDKLRIENSVLMEKLKMAELREEEEELCTDRAYDDEEAPSMVIENLLSRMDDSSRIDEEEEQPLENSNGRLHQLLDSNSRKDALTAS